MKGMKSASSPQPAPLVLTEHEKQQLDDLYVEAGAWTPQEAQAALGINRTTELIQRGYLGRCDTDMGPMLLLLAPGRLAIYNLTGKAQSLQRQIDRAYIRRSLKALGWRQTTPGKTVKNLTQYDTTDRMVEVETEHGLVLVTGTIHNGGVGRQQVTNIARRLRSSAVYHQFDVVLLTPNPRKAHQKAAQESAFMVMKTLLPENPGYPDVKRVKTLPGRAIPRDDIPFLAGESWKQDERLIALPDLTKRILRMNRSDRIDHALMSIDCDGVMTTAQLSRYYGLDLGDITDRPYIQSIVRPTHNDFRNEANVTFIATSKLIAKLDDKTLGHRAGTGEMRHLMSVSPGPRNWKAEHRESLRFEEPDAYYYDDEGQIHAIEFDTGTYTANVIDDKLTIFTDRGFKGIHWGVTSAKRQLNVTEKIRDRLGSDVLICPWWEPKR